jgi:hypothetical protein
MTSSTSITSVSRTNPKQPAGFIIVIIFKLYSHHHVCAVNYIRSRTQIVHILYILFEVLRMKKICIALLNFERILIQNSFLC